MAKVTHLDPTSLSLSTDAVVLGSLIGQYLTRINGKSGFRQQPKASLLKKLDALPTAFPTCDIENTFNTFPSLQPFLSTLLLNKRGSNNDDLSPSASLSSKSFSQLTANDGKIIASVFPNLIENQRKCGDDAVEELLIKYTVVKDMFQIPWLPACMEEIGLYLIGMTPFGLKVRMYFGAVLSILDILSDIVVTKMYYDTGMTGTANVTAGLLVLSTFLQCFCVYLNYNQAGKRTLLRELLIALCLVKPLADAYRVSQGKVQEPGEVFSPLSEMLCTKMVELFGESIPGLVVQVFALVSAESNEGHAVALTSIVLSAFSTGFASSMISYDLDVDVSKRKNNPKFYGYVPDGDGVRSVVFGAMTGISSCFVLSKTFAIAILAFT